MSEVFKINNQKLDDLQKKIFISPLAKSLLAYLRGENYYTKERNAFLVELEHASGKKINQMTSINDFYCNSLKKAVGQLTDKDFAEKLKEVIAISCNGQFSGSIYRKSYGSKSFRYHSTKVLYTIRSWVRFYFYEKNVEDFLRNNQEINAMEHFIALEINKNNNNVIDIIKDMILGDNNARISIQVIKGIIMSNSKEVKELLKDLLLAAKSQEGLRQSILEQIDSGDFETFKFFLKVCVDNDLFRFSSAARSLYVWTGIYNENIDIKFTRRMGEVAWQCVSDEEKRMMYFNSDNPYEIYLSLWAKGCQDISDTEEVIEELLNSDKKHKKLLGWFFIKRVENKEYQHYKAIDHLEQEDMCLLGAVTDSLAYNRDCLYLYSNNSDKYIAKKIPSDFYSKSLKERRELFKQLALIVEKIGHNKWEYPSYLFPWTNMVVNNDNCRALDCMISLACYDLNEELISRLHDYLPFMNVDRRNAYYMHLIDPDTSSIQRQYLLEGLKDKGLAVKTTCLKKLSLSKVKDTDLDVVTNMFSTKSGDLRKELMKFLSELDSNKKLVAINKLVKGSENHLQAAIELTLNDSSLTKHKDIILKATSDKQLSDQSKLLFHQLFPEEKKEINNMEISPDNGYGLFDPMAILDTVEKFSKDNTVGNMSEKEIVSLFPTFKQQEKLFEDLNNIFEKHKNYEYTYINYADERVTILFGDPATKVYIPEQYGKDSVLFNTNQAKISMLPFSDEFLEVFKDIIDDKKLLVGYQYMNKNSSINPVSGYLDNYLSFHNKYYARFDSRLTEKYKGRFKQFCYLIGVVFNEYADDQAARLTLDLCFSLYRLAGGMLHTIISKPLNIYYRPAVAEETVLFVNLRSMLRSITMSDEMFKLFFIKEYARERADEFKVGEILKFDDYMRAIRLNIITKEHLADYILYPGNNRTRGRLTIMTTLNKLDGAHYVNEFPWYKEYSEKMVRNLVIFEANRGQADTPISRIVNEIKKIEGTYYFVLLLKALGTEGFYHGYQWSANTKQANLSLLLRKTVPAKDENVETLKELLKDTNIKETRLIEAAMYCPQWASYIEEITGWNGLKKGVWFFHAHVSETFSADKETEVAIYSPISPQKFNDGLFDADWFRESYNQLGEKRFATLHKYAKYITSGSNTHKRSQLFADAATGKIDPTELEAEIISKRNQERIRAYAIIPLKQGDTSELLHRYEFISKYIKESKQFGAQRKESERKAGSIALENLAVTCGLFDVNRMLWKLEAAKNQEILPLLEKKEIEGYNIWMSIDENGDGEIQCEKEGKPLKTLPKSLTKNEYVVALKQTVKELKDQKIRSKETLETSMINSVLFTASELADLLDSFTIAPMLKKLVWVCGGVTGFIEKKDESIVLVDYEDKVYPLGDNEKLSIAHPYHLSEFGIWSKYMHVVYQKNIVQPFKQIFREYYPLTQDEKDEVTTSRRYAGYQVQPTKTAALLKSRGWTVDYEEGWQKVNYNDDTLVRLYSYADWFTAAEIEAPTLEVIRFYSRKKEEPIKLEDINPIYFSEVMRDIDLVVSVAYVGGVDVETSHSTVGMRKAIAKELCDLMKINNVEFLDKHVKVYGKLAEYSVHLGSGVVHASAKGAIVILPVHSQHRGHIFLPFVDDDPKTSEIMSKIILLAQDEKIKDPTILQQIN